MKQLIFTLVILVTATMAQAKNLLSGTFICSNDSRLTLDAKNRDPHTFYATLESKEGVSVLNEIRFSGTNPARGNLLNDDGQTLGRAVISKNGQRITLMFHRQPNLNCDRSNQRVFENHSNDVRFRGQRRGPQICIAREENGRDYVILARGYIVQGASLQPLALSNGSRVELLEKSPDGIQARIKVLSTIPKDGNRYGDDALDGQLGWLLSDNLECP